MASYTLVPTISPPKLPLPRLTRLSARLLRPRRAKARLALLKALYKDYRALRPAWRAMPRPILPSAPRLSAISPAAASSPAPAPTSPPVSSAASPPTSRRHRLLGMARAARDTYIPRLTLSVTQLALGVTRLPVDYDENGLPLVFPRGTTITLFPSYTRHVDGAFVVSVRGWVWCPGVMSRKNRLILSLAKQVVRYGTGGVSNDAAASAVDRLEDPALRQDLLGNDPYSPHTPRDSPQSSLRESLDAASLLSQDTVARAAPGLPDSLMRDRLSAFLARSISGASISVAIGSADSSQTQLVELTATTDANGHFDADVTVPYEPSVVQVRAHADDTVCLFQEVTVLADSGVGIISDIDDTVKVTGIVGDKRELMHRLLLGDMASWNIPSVVAWYHALRARGASFHYVLNLPWQLYLLIQQYFDTVRLPPGSVHLKQYTGNIILSLMEPSSSRKRNSLFKILAHFPQKRFVCVGDSGEQDLEAYADLAATYPGRVCAIYIRVVPDSLSDVDDGRILAELRHMMEEWSENQKSQTQNDCGQIKNNHSQTRPRRKSPPPLLDLLDSLGEALVPSLRSLPAPLSAHDLLSGSADQHPLVDLSDSLSAKKLPPMVPKKPASLRLAKLPPLPERKYLRADSTLSSTTTSSSAPPPPPPRRRETKLSPAYTFDNLQRLYGLEDFYELEDVDRRGALWIQRMINVLETLNGTQTKLHFFEDEDKEFFDEALHVVDEIAPRAP